MKVRLNRLVITAGLAIVALLGSAPAAKAGVVLVLTDQNTGDVKTVVGTGTPGSYSVATGSGFLVGNFTVNVSGTSNTPGDSDGPSGDIQNLDTNVKNNSGTTDRLTIMISSDGFTIPGAGLAYLHSNIETSSALKASPLAYQSYVTQGATTLSTGNQVYNPTASNSREGTFIRTLDTYVLSSRLFLTLGGGLSQKATGSTSVNTSSNGGQPTTLIQTPEPSTMVAVLAGLPLLALGTRLRRKVAA